jgi:hypothetical protein
MSFSYGAGSNPSIDYPRFLCRDTEQFALDGITRAYAFEDSEILMATSITLGVFQSSQFYSGTAGPITLSGTPVPWRRVGALLLNGLAASNSRLAMIQQLLDVRMDTAKAADMLRKDALALLEMEDNDGSFAIIEMVNNSFQFRDRFLSQIERRALA